MPYVKKLDPTWKPSEYPGLKVGDVCIITDTIELEKQGLIEVISEEDIQKARKIVEKNHDIPQEELSEFVCDVCGKEAKSRAGLAAHKRSHS